MTGTAKIRRTGEQWTATLYNQDGTEAAIARKPLAADAIGQLCRVAKALGFKGMAWDFGDGEG